MSTNDTEPREAAFFTTVREWGIVRGPEGILGGVISGLGARVGLAPWPARIIVILAAFLLFPLVMIGYAAGWALLPDTRGNIVIQNFGRGIMNVGALIGIAVFTLVGFFSFGDFRPFGRAWFGPDIASVNPGTPLRVIAVLVAIAVPVAIVAGVVALIVWLARRSAAPAAPAADGGEAVYAVTRAEARAAGATSGSASAAAAPPAPPHVPKAPPAPPRPTTPRVPGPGRAFYFVTLAWAFIAAAAVAWGSREEILAIYPVLAWGMLFFTGLGVILIVISLSGRRLGFLGFVGIAGLIPAAIVLIGHDELQAAYEGYPNPPDAIIEVGVPPTPFDATAGFAADYDTIFFGGFCYTDAFWSGASTDSTARIAVADPFDKPAEHDILAATTVVTMPRGTSLRVDSDGYAQATVFFADRDLVCEFSGFEGNYVSLTNANEPILTLNVKDDQVANTIIIEES